MTGKWVNILDMLIWVGGGAFQEDGELRNAFSFEGVDIWAWYISFEK